MKETKPESRSYTGALLGAAAGALLMYFLDPQKGRTRRSLIRNKLFSWNRRAFNRGERIAEDLKNRAYGKFQKLQHRRKAANVDDETLEQRVRSAIGRKVSHVKSIKIFVNNGEVGLAGPILNHEVDELIATVESVPGVVRVYDELSKYERAGSIPELQGDRQI